MKHTKGKWVIRKIGNIRYEVNSQDRYIAECPIPFAHQDYEVEEAEANAKLIAAAPDMLEALERVMRHFNNAVPGNCEGHNVFTLNDFANARKAIKKATGNKG